jgi:hypothetical protein
MEKAFSPIPPDQAPKERSTTVVTNFNVPDGYAVNLRRG